ncbi:SMI1/KNR4 family protein [Streptomyces lavendulae]|uniref:SMI1/KNR4 family protein n=1 Tax=Streptomyces lavendulae TaxID=1914 RepID=UPI00368E44F3
MQNSTVEEWSLFKSWLDLNAPETAAAVLPPVTSEVRDRHLSAIPMAIHPDLKSFYSLSDGTARLTEGGAPAAFLPPRYAPYGIERVVRAYAHMLDTVAYEVENGRSSLTIGLVAHREWLPFAASSSGDELVLDHRQGETYGAVLEFDESKGGYVPVWTSFRKMLAEINSAVLGRGTAGRYRARIGSESSSLEWYHPRFP